MFKRLRDKLSEKDKALFKLALWTMLIVWMVFFLSYSIVMARIFAIRSPFLFGVGTWGQVMTWVLPVLVVFTSLLTVIIIARYAAKKLSSRKKGDEEMYNQEWIVWGIVAYLLLLIFIIIRGFIKRKGRYTLKRAVNDLRPLLTLIWTMYFLIGSILVIPSIVRWTDFQLLQFPTGSAAYLVVSWTPFVFILTIFYLVISIASSVSKPWIRYTDSELELLRKEKEELKSRIRRLVPWLRK